MTTNTIPPTVHSTGSTLLGAGVGATFGLLIAQADMYKSAFARKHKVGYTAASVVSLGVIGGLIARGLSTKPNPAYVSPPPPNLPTPPPPPLQQTSGGGGSVLTVSPGLSVQTVPLNVQDSVLINLPPGSFWVSMDGAPVADKTSPIAFVFIGPISHTFVWSDATMQNYLSTYFFVVAPSATPTTNA
jgi:hypothetical protein